MSKQRHLHSVRTAHDEHMERVVLMRDAALRVPHEDRPVYDWSSPQAQHLFEIMAQDAAAGYSVLDVEERTGIPGLHSAFLDWLGGR